MNLKLLKSSGSILCCILALTLCGLATNTQADINDDLRSAAGSDNVKKVSRLLDNGADVNAKDKIGNTPLHYTAGWGHKDVAALLIAELLIAKGADVNDKNNDGDTPLHIAVKNGHMDVAELLRQKGGK